MQKVQIFLLDLREQCVLPFSVAGRHDKVCKMSTDQNQGFSNVNTYLGEKYVIYKNLEPIMTYFHQLMHYFQYRYFSIGDFVKVLYKNMNILVIYKKCPKFSGNCLRTRFVWFTAFLMSACRQNILVSIDSIFAKLMLSVCAVKSLIEV